MPALAWSGPQTTLVNKNGRKVVQICDQGGGCTTSTPFMVAVRNKDWPTSLYEAQLVLNWLSPSTNGVIPVIHVVLDAVDDATIDTAVANLNTLTPRPYVYLRLRADAPAGAFEAMQLANMQGATVADNSDQLAPFSMSAAWLTYQQNQITHILNRFDAEYPGRVVGVNIGYNVGHEWFFRSDGYDPLSTDGTTIRAWQDPKLCATGVDGVKKCGSQVNLVPWYNDSGAAAGPLGRHVFYLTDYSATTLSGFCGWSSLPFSLQSGCRAASVVERNNATPGLPMPALGLARGVFLDPADLNSLRSAYYNRYGSLQTANAIISILSAAKTVSGNRLLTSAYYGYENAIGQALPASGHTALAALLASSAVDIVAGPYSYDDVGSRKLGTAFLPQGIPDSPRLNGKLWADEDDTRTFFAYSATGATDAQTQANGAAIAKYVFNLWDTIRILRRNILSAGLHNTGSWFLDLGGPGPNAPAGPSVYGWFGQPSDDNDSQVLWANLTNAFTGLNKLQLSAPNRFDAQVAIFTDEISPSYVAAVSPAGEQTADFWNDAHFALQSTLARLGTPVKQYLLSDLLNPNLDLSAVKLAILPNAWSVPANIRAAIDSRLRTNGRTLLFVYAAGYINGDSPAAVSNISAFTGINVVAGTGAPLLTQSSTATGAPETFGPAYPLTPWFRVSDAGATAMASYTANALPSLAKKPVAATGGGTYTSIYAAAPGLPLDLLRKISQDAGVFHFTAAGDIVEAAGNMVMIHAATTSITKSVQFPQTMSRILETAIYPSDSPMCSNCSLLTNLSFTVGDTRVFRWTSAPIGNFELIGGGAAQGWAADLDVPDQSIAINLYLGAPFGQGGTFLAGFGATTSRPDVAAAFGIAPNKGFAQPLPSCPSGQPVYAYALDPESPGDGSTLIGVHTCP